MHCAMSRDNVKAPGIVKILRKSMYNGKTLKWVLESYTLNKLRSVKKVLLFERMRVQNF